jgi:tetratricopeptide (TPR) repeat protein
MKNRVPCSNWFGGIVILVAGCSPSVVTPGDAFTSPTSHTYLAHGRAFAERGESARAEQYYLAALQAGAVEEEVFSLLLDTCVKQGRLGSAVAYVEARLRKEPSNESLLRLSASLREALGHRRAALSYVAELSRLSRMLPETQLFVAEFLQRSGDTLGAHTAFEAYAKEVPESERPPWVAFTLRRLREAKDGHAALAEAGGRL